MMTLSDTFENLVRNYTDDSALCTKLWQEIEAAHSTEGRYYHTLHHLEHFYAQLDGASLQDRDAVLFAVFYHDIVYKVPGTINEEESSGLAEARMRILGLPESRIEKVLAMILATKKHEPSGDADTDLFTDADLSILGAERELYARYASNVRREYRIYTDDVYGPGRRQVLAHFIGMERIFKTNLFYNRFEASARENLEWELKQL